jgi:hypothetical protein
MTNKRIGSNKSVESRRFFLKYFLAFLMMLLCTCESFLAGQFYIIYKLDWAYYFGPKRIGPYATKEEAVAVWNKMCAQPNGVGESAKRNTEIVGTPTGGGSNQSSLSPYYSGDDPRLQLFGALLGYIFAKPDTSARDALAKQKEEEKKKEEERKEEERIEAVRRDKEKSDAQNAAALEEWRRQQDAEKEERENQSRDLLGKIGAVGGDAAASSLTSKPIGTDFFGTGGPTGAKLRTSGPGQYPTSGFTALQSLQASADFLLNAAAATGGERPDYEEAVFLAQQADKVIQRQPTNVKSRFAALPDVPPAPPEPKAVAALEQRVVILATSLKKSVEAIQATEIKIAELDVEVKAAERKKTEARVKLKEVEAKVAAAKPEEKAQVDDLKRQAEQALRDAESLEAKGIQEKALLQKNKEQQSSDLASIKDQLKEIEDKLKNPGK